MNYVEWGDPDVFGTGPSALEFIENGFDNDGDGSTGWDDDGDGVHDFTKGDNAHDDSDGVYDLEFVEGAPFVLASVYYFNGMVLADTGINSVRLRVELDARDFTLGLDRTWQQEHLLMLVNTPNTGSLIESADWVHLAAPLIGFPSFHVLEGAWARADIMARLVAGSVVPGALATAAGGPTLELLGFANVSGDGFLSRATPIPEPSTGLLIAAGLVASLAKGRFHRYRLRRSRSEA